MYINDHNLDLKLHPFLPRSYKTSSGCSLVRYLVDAEKMKTTHYAALGAPRFEASVEEVEEIIRCLLCVA